MCENILVPGLAVEVRCCMSAISNFIHYNHIVWEEGDDLVVFEEGVDFPLIV